MIRRTSQTETAVRFATVLVAIDSSVIARLPKDASESLPSRGPVAVGGSINGHEFETVLDPDGMKGHWLRVDQELQAAIGVGPGAARQRRCRGPAGLAGAGRQWQSPLINTRSGAGQGA